MFSFKKASTLQEEGGSEERKKRLDHRLRGGSSIQFSPLRLSHYLRSVPGSTLNPYVVHSIYRQLFQSSSFFFPIRDYHRVLLSTLVYSTFPLIPLAALLRCHPPSR